MTIMSTMCFLQDRVNLGIVYVAKKDTIQAFSFY